MTVEIVVYAKTNKGNQFIGVFDDLSNLNDDVFRQLENARQPNLIESTYFLLNGEEYKLYMEVDR